MYLDWLTKVPDLNAQWMRESQDIIRDDVLGTFNRQGESNSYVGEMTVKGLGQFSLSFFDTKKLDDSLLFARSVVSALTRLDPIYKRIAAKRLKKWTAVLGNRAASRSEIRAALELSHAEVWYPNSADPNIGASLWYRGGKLFGGARICVALSSKRTLNTIGIG